MCKRKKLSELTLKDNFMFGAVMANPQKSATTIFPVTVTKKMLPCNDNIFFVFEIKTALILSFVWLSSITLVASLATKVLVCSASFVASAVGGLIVSLRHLSAYTSTNPLSSSCRLKADFPSFLPLDEIAPWMFKPFALCSEKIDWEFLGQGMPFWIVLIFSVSLFIAAMMFLSCFVKNKAKNFNRLYR